MTTYNAAYFISKFDAIPEEMWCVAKFTIDDKHCALGHCRGEHASNESLALMMLFKRHIEDWVSHINDGFSIVYTQPTPKLRILAALREIQEKGG